MTKVQSHMMLVLHNVRMVPLNVKKNKGTTECDKVQLYVILVLHNVKMVLSNVRKKIRELLNVTKGQSHLMLIL